MRPQKGFINNIRHSLAEADVRADIIVSLRNEEALNVMQY